MSLIKTKSNYQWMKKQGMEESKEGSVDAIIKQLQLFVKDVRDDIFQLNPTLFTTLPTAEEDKRGSFVIKEASSVEDLLNICIRDAAGAFLYKQISLNINVKGADVASASSMTLGNDGDTFDITGTTNITSITIKPAGTVVKLQFDGVLTVTDGGNLKIGGDFITAAESTLTLRSDGTNWVELGRSPISSSPTEIKDGDGDTKVETERTSDDDIIYLRNAGNDSVVINASGEMTKPTQPAFQVINNGAQNNINNDGNHQTIILDLEIFDIGNNFASNAFTASVTGKYPLFFLVTMQNVDSASSGYRLTIRTSNRDYIMSFDPRQFAGDIAGNWTFSISILADLDVNDTASCSFVQDAGTAQTDIPGNLAKFSGFLAT